MYIYTLNKHLIDAYATRRLHNAVVQDLAVHTCSPTALVTEYIWSVVYICQGNECGWLCGMEAARLRYLPSPSSERHLRGNYPSGIQSTLSNVTGSIRSDARFKVMIGLSIFSVKHLIDGLIVGMRRSRRQSG